MGGVVAVLMLGALSEGIAQNAKPAANAAGEVVWQSVLPEAAFGVFVAAETKGFVYEKGYGKPDSTDLVGYVVTATGRGYSSNIASVVGGDLYGRITGLKIVSHEETPGVGEKITEVKPSKSILDALNTSSGPALPRKVPIDLGSAWRGIVQVKDAGLAAELEKALASRDTAKVVALVPQAVAVDRGPALGNDRALTYKLGETTVKKLREDVMPWWQTQFIGKRGAEVVLAKEKSDKSIQGITGATMSSKAVTESVRGAITQLATAVGGFKEIKP